MAKNKSVQDIAITVLTSFFSNKKNVLACIFILLPSIVLIQKYFNTFFSVIYFLFFIFSLVAVQTFKLKNNIFKIATYIVIAGSVIVYLIIIHLLAPPYSGGIDRDDMLNATSIKILNGESPYDATWVIYFRHGGKDPILAVDSVNVLPFTLLFTIPFHLLGNVAYQDIIAYLFIVFLLVITYSGERNRFWAVFVFSTSPLILFEFMCLNDLLVGMALLLWTIHFLYQHKDIVMSILLTCAALTRPILLIPAALIGGRILKTRHLKEILIIAAVTLLLASIFVVPFMLIDKQGVVNVFTVNSMKFDRNVNPFVKYVLPEKHRGLVISTTLLVLAIIAGYFLCRRRSTAYLISSALSAIFLGAFIFIRMSADYTHLIWIALPAFFAFSFNREINKNSARKNQHLRRW